MPSKESCSRRFLGLLPYGCDKYRKKSLIPSGGKEENLDIRLKEANNF
jgi:hypothetical protein